MNINAILKSALLVTTISFFTIYPQVVFSQYIAPKEDLEFSNKWEAQLNHALSSNHLHSARNEPHSTRSCLSAVLREGKNNQELLTPRLQKILKTYDERPTLSFAATSTHYRFHYDKTGDDAVDTTDDNGNDIPDYVEFMGNEFENVYKKQTQGLGFIAPPSDGTEGGDNLYDVYISNIDAGVYGYVSQETTIGDNPNSTPIETQAATSWMAMRNNYDDFGVQEIAIKVTAAHEFFHAIQMGYNTEPSAFAFEGTATWMEEEIYNGLDDNFQYLSSVFGSPDVALNYDFADDSDPDFEDNQNYWYGSWIFFEYIGENYGTDMIKKFWENLRSKPELEALNTALLSKNATSNAAFEDFFVANLVLSASTAAKPYIYARAADYLAYLRENINSETIKIEGNLDFSGQTKTWNSTAQGNNRLMRFSADYIQLNTQQEEFKVEISPNNPNGSEIGVQFVALQSNGQVRVIKNYPSAGQGAKIEVKNVNATDKMYLIVYRTGKINDDFTSQQYTLTISSLSQVTGIEDKLAKDNYFKIASNPVSDNLRFVYQLDNQNLKNYTITITDVLGRKITENKAISEIISTSKWTKGTYLVTLLENQKPIAVRKIMVQ